jgi:twitching motility protein PilT
MTAAETGHLVMSTLHTMDATETVNRVISIFPPHQQKQVRLQLGAVIKAIICQRLVPTSDGKGRICALEILRQTPRVRELIEDKDRAKEIVEAIEEGNTTYGMQTFDQSLMMLYKSGLITYEEAERNSTNPGNFALRVQGIHGTSDSKWDNFESKRAAAQAAQAGQATMRSGSVAAPTPRAQPAPPARAGTVRPQSSATSNPLDDDLIIER